MIDENAYIKAIKTAELRDNLRAVYPESDKFWAHERDRMLIGIYETNRTNKSEDGK